MSTERTHKTCPDCHRHLPLSDFPKRGSKKRRGAAALKANIPMPYCHDCHRIRNRRYQQRKRALLAEAHYNGVRPENEREELIYLTGKEHGQVQRNLEMLELQEEIKTLRHLLMQQ